MRSATVLSFLSAVALGAPTPNPLRIGSESPGSEHKRSPANPNVDDSKFSIGLGIPAVVVDGHPIKIPHVKRDPADDVNDSKFSIGSHSIITGGPAVSIDGHAKGGSVGNDPGSSIHIHIRDPEPNLAKKRSAEIITGASAIGFGTSATGGSVSLSGDSKGKDGACKNGKHGKDGKDGKDGTEGAGIANGGNGGDALVPGSRAGNGGNGGIIINP